MKHYFFLIALASGLLASQGHAADRVALVIGQANYSAATPLPQALTDTDAIVATLQQLNFETVSVTDATRSILSDALAQFADRAAGAEIAVLYYSGHGISAGQNNYLLPIDAHPSNGVRIRLDAIDLQDAISMLSKAKNKLVLINTATNNPFLATFNSSIADVQADNSFAPVKDAGATLFVSQAQTLATDTEEPSSYVTRIIEAMGQPDADLASALAATAAKIDSKDASKIVQFGSIPARLRLGMETGAQDATVTDNGAQFNQLGDEFRDGRGREKNAAMALVMYLKAASHGAQDRAAVIAEMYDTGTGAPRDPDKATEWYGKAGAEGEYLIGRRHEFGNGIRRDFDGSAADAVKDPSELAEAAVWYKRSAEHGYAPAQSYLGYLHTAGRIVEKNSSLGESWLLKAAGQNYVPAMMDLGVFYKNGDGVTKDTEAARKWFTKAVELGSTRAMIYLAGLELDRSPPDYRAAMELYKKGAARGDAFAMKRVGDLFQDGQGVKKDYAEALYWYRKAIDAGEKLAFGQIGMMYINASRDFLNYAEGGKWLERAADAGDYRANLTLARLFAMGLGCRKDNALAVQLVELAIRKDDGARFSFKWDVSNWPPEFRQAFQRSLIKRGLYHGKADGRFGDDARAAIDALAKS